MIVNSNTIPQEPTSKKLRVRCSTGSNNNDSHGTPTPTPEEDIEKDSSHCWCLHSKEGRKWNNSFHRSIQLIMIWILAKSRFRYILGLYTCLITIFLHYGAKTLVFEVEQQISATRESNSQPLFTSRENLRRQKQQLQQPISTDANIVSWRLSESTKQNLQYELNQLFWTDKNHVDSTISFIEQAKQIISTHVMTKDPSLKQLLLDLMDDKTSIEVIVFDNLPMDTYIPSTPNDGSVSLQKPSFVAEALLVAFGELADTYTVGYKAEKEYSNPWVHEGFPRPNIDGKVKASALTGADHVPFHQDMSYHGIVPDILGLTCLREGDKGATTTLVSIEKLMQLLPRETVAILRQPKFRIEASGWVDKKEVKIASTRPILEGKSLHLPVHWENMVGVDEEATQAVDILRSTLQSLQDPSGIHLVDGDMVLFNNHKVIHGRTPYTNLKFDGTDRVVLRSYFVRNLNDEAKKTRML